VKPAPFAYHRPGTVAEVIDALSRLEDAKLLAGGQSLMPMMNFRYVTPANVVDLNRVPELTGIAEDGDAVVIGAMTRQCEIKDSALVAAHCPLLAEALHHVGHVQTRHRGTIGGSLAYLDPAAELPGVLLAHDAVLEVEGRDGARSIPMSQWPLGYMTPALEAGELLVRVQIPAWPPGHGFGFSEVARRHGDFAMAGAGALVQMDGGSIRRCAIALVGVDDGPVRLDAAEALLTGNAPTPGRLDAAARAALDVPGIEDVHASAAYRRKIAAVVTRRALDQALARTRGGHPGHERSTS
jgi:carbon-monoxide dehydrogenase medium subunit